LRWYSILFIAIATSCEGMLIFLMASQVVAVALSIFDGQLYQLFVYYNKINYCKLEKTADFIFT